jgi:hypothetical protein
MGCFLRNPSTHVAVETPPVGYGAITAEYVEALRWRLTHPTEEEPARLVWRAGSIVRPDALPPYENAAFTLPGVNGTRRSRTPVASKMALAIAAATGRLEGSPAPEGGMSG